MLSYIAFPFSWLLLTLYQLTGSYPLALFGFSLVIKLILFPFYMKGKKGTMKMARLNPKVKALEKKYEGNQQKYSQEVQKLYKEENVHPMSGCLWNLIPYPILLLLYSIIRHPITMLMRVAEEHLPTIASIAGFTGDYASAYGQMQLASAAAPYAKQIAAAGVLGFVAINYTFLGLDLSAVPQFLFFTGEDPWHWVNIGLWLIPIISGAFALLQSIVAQKLNPATPSADGRGTGKSMYILMPLISIWIGFAMPAAMSIYWITNSILGIAQDYISTKYYKRVFAREDAEKLAAEAEREAAFAEKRRVREEKIAETGSTYRDKNTSKKKIQKAERTQSETAEREYKIRTGQVAPPPVDADRPFARGRAYDPNRYADVSAAAEKPAEKTPAPKKAGSAPADVPQNTADEDDAVFYDESFSEDEEK